MRIAEHEKVSAEHQCVIMEYICLHDDETDKWRIPTVTFHSTIYGLLTSSSMATPIAYDLMDGTSTSPFESSCP